MKNSILGLLETTIKRLLQRQEVQDLLVIFVFDEENVSASRGVRWIVGLSIQGVEGPLQVFQEL